MILKSKYFKTSDGVCLHYLEAGTGLPIILLPGGGFSNQIFNEQFDSFSQHFQVIALDQRGHGQSDKPDFGYRIARLAKDLHDLTQHLQMNQFHLLGHSLGTSVIYQYMDLFGDAPIQKIILVDEPCILMYDPAWSAEKMNTLGAIYSPNNIHELLNRFLSDDALSFKQGIIDQMTTTHAGEELKKELLQFMDLPAKAAKTLYLNNVCQDYRDVLSQITRPVLYITGEASLHPPNLINGWPTKSLTPNFRYFQKQKAVVTLCLKKTPNSLIKLFSTF